MTEKNYNPQQKEMKVMKKQEYAQKSEKKVSITNEKAKQVNAPIEKEEKKDEIKNEEKSKEIEKKKEEKKEKPKRTSAFVNVKDIPISVKYSAAICRFIKHKKINDAISQLEQVISKKRPIPMKGEIPHRKGDIMSGRFPQKASKNFIIILKSLSSNCSYHGIENPIISQAFANIGVRPFGRGGTRKKRTHIFISAISADDKGKEKK